MSEPRESSLADLLACIAAFGRSMQAVFDPQRFLAEFSARAQRLVAHDRVIITYLEEDGRTFTIFAEHSGKGPAVHEGRYTTDFDPSGRYTVDDWNLARVFAGGDFLLVDAEHYPGMPLNPTQRARFMAAGVRAGVAVPMYASGRVIGGFGVASFLPGVYGDEHVAACREIADVIGPFVQSVVLFLRERRRRARLKAVAALVPILGASLKVGDLLERLGDALHPVVAFDAMAVRVVNADGRAREMIGVPDAAGERRYAGMTAPNEYSKSDHLARARPCSSTTLSVSSILVGPATRGSSRPAADLCSSSRSCSASTSRGTRTSRSGSRAGTTTPTSKSSRPSQRRWSSPSSISVSPRSSSGRVPPRRERGNCKCVWSRSGPRSTIAMTFLASSPTRRRFSRRSSRQEEWRRPRRPCSSPERAEPGKRLSPGPFTTRALVARGRSSRSTARRSRRRS